MNLSHLQKLIFLLSTKAIAKSSTHKSSWNPTALEFVEHALLKQSFASVPPVSHVPVSLAAFSWILVLHHSYFLESCIAVPNQPLFSPMLRSSIVILASEKRLLLLDVYLYPLFFYLLMCK